ncbi:MAG: glycogen/starch/alpha-glucan phosphorylase [Thermodesulfobacteriota bacterium]
MTVKPVKPAYREPENARTGCSVKAIKQDFIDNLFYHQARFPAVATPNDYYLALAYTVRDRLLYRWINTAETYREKASRTVCYLSAEFLLGPHLANNLINLGIDHQTRRALKELGLHLDRLIEQEEEPGLGNGGLGRLAACYMDSLATLSIPAIGYGIRYEFGIFDQEIKDGWQVEVTDKWLRLGNPWEIAHPELALEVKAGGRTEAYHDENGRYKVRWIPDRVIRGIPYDTPILGYAVNTANLLRLWKAEACESFDLQAFNVGDYYGSVEDKMVSENITKVLYPNDEPAAGKELRLLQQYFFVSCSLQDMLRIYEQKKADLSSFHVKYAVQLNDTHPAVAVAELMRIFIDERGMKWEPAWEIVQGTFSYTNHTLLPEALEKWPLPLFQRLLPRHLEIIHEINARFLADVRERYPEDSGLAERLSLIDEAGERYVRMANLACVGSHTINGVAGLHSELLKRDVLRDFFRLWPEKFTNVTNGVTQRRFMVLANPCLTELISSRIGRGWISDLSRINAIEEFMDDPDFRAEWRNAKLTNKQSLAALIHKRTGIPVDPHSLFDIHVKRIHEYKRQHLNVLHILTLYLRLKRDPRLEAPPRTCIFGGKAAPGYVTAKLMIKLINSTAELVNNDPDIRGRLKVVFFPDFNVKNSHAIYPAADLSEQISTAGKEASGTGNMKFSMNGALTIGTLDGANVEIRREVGPDNFFLFGLTADEIQDLHARGYRPREYYEHNAQLREVLDLIASGALAGGDRDLFRNLVESLLNHDSYCLLADYQAYIEAQDRVNRTYLDPELWTRMSMANVARMGQFSSDRAIREYCDGIWRIEKVPIHLKSKKSR